MSSVPSPTIGSPSTTEPFATNNADNKKIFGQVALTVTAVASAIASLVSTLALFPEFTSAIPLLGSMTQAILPIVTVNGAIAIAASGAILAALSVLGIIKLSQQQDSTASKTQTI